jgi:hypothetical protein
VLDIPILTDMRLRARSDPIGPIQAAQIKRKTSAQRQLLQVKQLSPPIALSKRMDVVHVANNDRGLGAECIWAKANQKTLRNEPLMNVAKAGGDEAQRHELRAAFRDFHGTDFSGPVVDVLEEMAVNGAEVPQIERAGWNAFRRALADELSLNIIQQVRLGQSKLVTQNARSRIDVGIRGRHASVSLNLKIGEAPKRHDKLWAGGSSALNPREYVSSTPFVRPALTLEHLKHLDLIRAERIAFDLLERHGVQASAAGFLHFGGSQELIFANIGHV